MNFKRIVFLSLGCLLQFFSYAQTATLEWGPATELKLEDSKYMACTNDNTCYILDLNSSKSYFFITKLNSLSPQGDKLKVNIPEINGNIVDIREILAIDGELILLTSYSDDKAKTRTFYAYHFNNDLSLKQKPGIVGIVKNVGKKDYGQSKYFLSDDGKTLCFFRRTPADSLSVGFTATDKHQNILWDFDVNCSPEPYGGNKAQAILPDGTFAFAVRVDKTKREIIKGQPEYYYKIYIYDPKTKKYTETKLDLESKYIQPVKFAVDVSGNLLCGGLYSLHPEYAKGGFTNYINGVFCLVLDKNSGAILNQEIKSLGNDNEKPTIMSYSYWNFQLNQFVSMSDGTLMFLTEQFGNNIMIAMMNLQTHNFGHFKIEKDQGGNDRDYTYLTWPQKNKVHIVLNVDEELMRKTTAKGSPKYLSLDSKNVIFYQFSIDSKSKVDQNKVKTNDIDAGYILDRSLHTKANENTYIVSAKTEKGAYRFGKLVLK